MVLVMAMVMVMEEATVTVTAVMGRLRLIRSRCGKGYWGGKKKPESRSQSPDKKLDLDNCLRQYESRNTHNKNKFHLDSGLWILDSFYRILIESRQLQFFNIKYLFR
jgi:hypothetical protein